MRSNPTGRQLRLGSELRKLRERAGLTSTQASQLLGVKQNQVSNTESGRMGVSPDRVRALACHYECADHGLVDALVSMAGERVRGWWEEYRAILPAALLDLAEVEHHARHMRTAITVHTPGLLQTAEHAREVFRQDVPAIAPPDIEHRVSFRIKRQAVLFREEPTPYHAIIHEAALRMQLGGTAVAKGQLQHLLDMSERPGVVIQILPFSAGSFAGSGQSIFYSHGPVPSLDTVHLDQSHGPVFLDAEAQLAKYRVLIERMEAIALPVTASRDFIHTIAASL
ncbi:helix-turn-helix domain-containing protein [Streptomyces violascens]|uniref:helix-turn-helix domain-containing protein n=1 Tax=Streptomyces violascens TaxID=67381 RepID=UPI0036544E9F